MLKGEGQFSPLINEEARTMWDRSRSGVLTLVAALTGLTACQFSSTPLGMAAATPVPRSALPTAAQPLTLANDAVTSVVDGGDVNQLTQGIRIVIASRVSGLEVVRDSGSAHLRITGSASGSGRNPLFVIDGVPVADGFGLTLVTRAIERIDVFQDAATIAPYGPRAANGVVLIATTRAH